MNACHEAGFIGIGELHPIERDEAFAGGGALGGLEDEPGAVIDGDLFGIAGDRVLDRLAAPEPIWSKASRCSGEAFSSTNRQTVPLPS